MEVISTVAEWRTYRRDWDEQAGIGFVPTMGYLHDGHLSLVQAARSANRFVCASIFVNPMQFGPSEDFAAYPRALERDLALLERAGVDAVFTPAVSEMYPDGFATAITLTGPLVERLEGARRPGHFSGVATVVAKLLLIMQPTHAYFGQKDAQQLAVVQRMVTDIHLPCTIVPCPIVREPDGLAMSSRNVYLTPDERNAATVLYRSLREAQTLIQQGETRAVVLREFIKNRIAIVPLAHLDYIDVVDPATFQPLDSLAAPALLPLVVQIGKPHLLDNFLWRADGTWETGTGATQ